MAGPHSPPLTRTRTIGLKPGHFIELAELLVHFVQLPSYSSLLSLSLYKVKSKFPYVLNLLSRPWNACLDVLRLACTFPRTMAVPTILFRIGGVTLRKDVKL
ncbi:hypothetical protein IGI04_014913 [Brassica rapa subsp. trilocularis]|uniref:Uncharacterized protein n=1 Tax=Brassica rapa subsp. trilocularis TaxID=1813537 RepID=A0ABQ7MNI8_BRACM|nr:hypothetical protein IGI04_014913 [Brassica rapa subsp. trilocularis]